MKTPNKVRLDAVARSLRMKIDRIERLLIQAHYTLKEIDPTMHKRLIYAIQNEFRRGKCDNLTRLPDLE